MTLAAGRLRHRIRLEVYASLQDSNGDFIQDPETGEVSKDWKFIQEVWAAVEPLSGREIIAAQGQDSKISARITIRWGSGVRASNWRAVHGVRVYNIEAVLEDKDSGMEYETLLVSRGISDTGL